MISTPLTGFYFSKLALIDAHATPNGIEYNFTNCDRWVETFQRTGVIGSIEGSHVLRREEDPDDPTPLKVDAYVLEDGKAVLKGLPADDPRAQTALRPMLIALGRHLRQKGWLSFYYQHVLDEVDGKEMPLYREYAALVHEAMPGVRTMDAVDARRDLDVYEKSCDVWVPVSYHVFFGTRGTGDRCGSIPAWFLRAVMPTVSSTMRSSRLVCCLGSTSVST